MLLYQVADSQIVTGTSATLTFTHRDSDGEPDTSIGSGVTVAVTSSDGTEVVASTSASTTLGVSTTTLTAAQTATPEQLIATWTYDSVAVGRTVHDVIGAPSITRERLQELQPHKAGKISSAVFLRRRREVDDFFLRHLCRSMFPRLTVERIEHSGSADVVLRYPDLRSVAWARVDDGDGTTTSITNVDNIQPSSAGIASHIEWVSGWLEIGYLHGWDRPSWDAEAAVAAELVEREFAGKGAVDARSQEYTDPAGYAVSTIPGMEAWSSVPMVNKFIAARRWHPPVLA